MITSYGLWGNIYKRLVKDNGLYSVKNYTKYNQIKKAYIQGTIKKEDVLIYLRFSKGDRNLQDQLHEEGYKLFPSYKFSKFIRNREEYLKEVDKITKYPLKRLYVRNVRCVNVEVLNNYFGNEDIVMKVGNFHASAGKWLITKGRKIPYLKYDYRDIPITFEEFISNARSIRIGYIGNPNSLSNYFITEHINSKTWLKNNHPDKELTYSYEDRHKLGIDEIDNIIEDVKNIGITYGANLLGVDYVINQDRIGLLELNDIIGLPEGKFAEDLFYKTLLKEIIK